MGDGGFGVVWKVKTPGGVRVLKFFWHWKKCFCKVIEESSYVTYELEVAILGGVSFRKLTSSGGASGPPKKYEKTIIFKKFQNISNFFQNV